MKNAFESTFSQVRENNPTSVDSMTSQQADIVVKDKITTKQRVAKLTRQHVNKSTLSQEDLNLAELERKTFYIKRDLFEMFKYAKFKTKVGESQIANIALETYFNQQFGKNWRTLLK